MEERFWRRIARVNTRGLFGYYGSLTWRKKEVAELGDKFDVERLPRLQVNGRSTPLDVFNVRWTESGTQTLKEAGRVEEQLA